MLNMQGMWQNIDCSECQHPHVIHVYALHKLRYAEVLKLQALIGDVLYTCGSTLQELDIEGAESSELLSKVFVRANLTCQNPVEVPYYSSDSFVDVCVHCASSSDFVSNVDVYPTCKTCFETKAKIYRRKRKQFQPKMPTTKKIITCTLSCTRTFLYLKMHLYATRMFENVLFLLCAFCFVLGFF